MTDSEHRPKPERSWIAATLQFCFAMFHFLSIIQPRQAGCKTGHCLQKTAWLCVFAFFIIDDFYLFSKIDRVKSCQVRKNKNAKDNLHKHRVKNFHFMHFFVNSARQNLSLVILRR
ncbi:hypothetical protein CLOSTMETH_03660 [[Clostridium] methylpentosum DSM 5476]|uniref:Uncharacterized protein n=1 Tax=[Clostridium] methylpentosum DSM 5476 TaxID=537013 RepID=C0EIG5_9FIRM|nr:hypothetical protein CLOSTMETH_03660 [[Clostridium] methylpentosum DSM 5476]